MGSAGEDTPLPADPLGIIIPLDSYKHPPQVQVTPRAPHHTGRIAEITSFTDPLARPCRAGADLMFDRDAGEIAPGDQSGAGCRLIAQFLPLTGSPTCRPINWWCEDDKLA